MTESSARPATNWEYRLMVKQTDRQMLLELNQFGQQGWEAITMSYDKDLKGVMQWTCWLKRPAGVAAEPAQATVAAPATVATPAMATHDTAGGPKQPDGFDLSDGDFGLKD